MTQPTRPKKARKKISRRFVRRPPLPLSWRVLDRAQRPLMKRLSILERTIVDHYKSRIWSMLQRVNASAEATVTVDRLTLTCLGLISSSGDTDELLSFSDIGEDADILVMRGERSKLLVALERLADTVNTRYAAQDQL